MQQPFLSCRYACAAVGRCVALLLLAWLLLSSSPARAQLPAAQVDPGDFGLLIPQDGPARPGEGRRVTLDDDEKEVVAKVLVDVGNYRIVMMPDGRLKSLEEDQTTPTEKPFVAATKDEVAEALLSSRFQGFRSRSTRRFVYIYNTSDGFYTATSRILESMYPPVLAFFERHKGFNVHHAEVPLIVIMFRTEKEFQAYQQMPPGVVAYYNAVSNHVVMYEQSELMEVAPDLAVKQSIGTIAHEGIHLILHNIGVQKRLADWPLWISEGLAEYFAPTSVDKRMRWKGVGTPNDIRMYELSQFLKNRPDRPESGSLVRRAVESAQFQSVDYATSWALAHYLATRSKPEFMDYLAEMSKLEPFSDRNLGEKRTTSADLVETFAKHFGKDYAKLEQNVLNQLKKLPYSDPVENQTHYVAMIVIDQGAAVQRRAGITASPAAVKKWQQEALAEVPAAQRNRVSFSYQVFPSRTAASTFADQWLSRRQ